MLLRINYLTNHHEIIHTHCQQYEEERCLYITCQKHAYKAAGENYESN